MGGCYAPSTMLTIYLISFGKLVPHTGRQGRWAFPDKDGLSSDITHHRSKYITSHYSQISLSSGFQTGSESRGTEKVYNFIVHELTWSKGPTRI